MKNRRFLNLILILAIALALAVFARAICDEDASFDSLCIFVFLAGELLAGIFSRTWSVLETAESRVYRQQVISYLALQEKSPPLAA